MTHIPPSARELIASGAHARLVTLNPDGSPQVTVVWATLDGEDLLTTHLFESKKVRNIKKDSRVAVTFESNTRSSMGLKEYLVLYGRASIEAGGAPELLKKMARTYLGPEVKFPPMDDPPPGFIARIRVKRISGVGPWTGRSG